jgi:osmotically inducible lipoprotein OsmB
MVQIFKPIIAIACMATLAACGDNDVSRGVTGAAAGAVVAGATKNDVATGALIGAAAGVVSDDVMRRR